MNTYPGGYRVLWPYLKTTNYYRGLPDKGAAADDFPRVFVQQVATINLVQAVVHAFAGVGRTRCGADRAAFHRAYTRILCSFPRFARACKQGLLVQSIEPIPRVLPVEPHSAQVMCAVL